MITTTEILFISLANVILSAADDPNKQGAKPSAPIVVQRPSPEEIQAAFDKWKASNPRQGIWRPGMGDGTPPRLLVSQQPVKSKDDYRFKVECDKSRGRIRLIAPTSPTNDYVQSIPVDAAKVLAKDLSRTIDDIQFDHQLPPEPPDPNIINFPPTAEGRAKLTIIVRGKEESSLGWQNRLRVLKDPAGGRIQLVTSYSANVDYIQSIPLDAAKTLVRDLNRAIKRSEQEELP
jgi:hypothetical protein